MAYMNQERKAKIAQGIKPILKKYGMKATLAVHNHTSIVLNIKSGPIDFGRGHMDSGYTQINPYHYQSQHTGKALEFLSEIMTVLNNGNWDNSDIMTDFFDTGWYVHVNVGRWDKPYILTKE